MLHALDGAPRPPRPTRTYFNSPPSPPSLLPLRAFKNRWKRVTMGDGGYPPALFSPPLSIRTHLMRLIWRKGVGRGGGIEMNTVYRSWPPLVDMYQRARATTFDTCDGFHNVPPKTHAVQKVLSHTTYTACFHTCAQYPPRGTISSWVPLAEEFHYSVSSYFLWQVFSRGTALMDSYPGS